MHQTLDSFYSALWQDYLQFSPSAGRIHQLLGGGGPIVNDHIALRTFNAAGIGLEVLAGHFIDMGYRPAGDYRFVAKKLRAKHYQHPDPAVPKVFISELLLEECSATLNQLVAGLLRQMDPGCSADSRMIYSGRHWALSQADYQTLLAESEYAAWLAAFGFRANHFTVSVNQLAGFDSLAQVNALLKQNGFALNTAGGEIKGSAQLMLEQSATLADRVRLSFSDGEARIPACFYEFAYRYPQADGSLYQGFVEASADKIFESTNVA